MITPGKTISINILSVKERVKIKARRGERYTWSLLLNPGKLGVLFTNVEFFFIFLVNETFGIISIE